jgi:hypothetical protein
MSTTLPRHVHFALVAKYHIINATLANKTLVENREKRQHGFPSRAGTGYTTADWIVIPFRKYTGENSLNSRSEM